MKIHSDFRDYYDIGLSVGLDPKLHYQRKERLFYLSELNHWRKMDIRGRFDVNWKKANAYEYLVVGFCGQVYPCMAIHWNTGSEYIYDVERIAHLFPKEPQFGARRYRRRYENRERQQVAFMRGGHRNDALFLELQAPLFVVRQEEGGREIRLLANTMMRTVQFAKVKDPFTAFQEISMYLGNQLVKRDKPDTIADEYRIAMHGFDKHSFRHPTRTSDL